MSDAYLFEVVGEGLANGRSVAVNLGHGIALSRRLAVRWLCGQATRIADGLDPDPAAAWHSAALLRMPASLPDAARDLRAWRDDMKRQEEAMHQLARGEPFILTVCDLSGRYTLAIWPITNSPESSAVLADLIAA
jgi:hypothetical protein